MPQPMFRGPMMNQGGGSPQPPPVGPQSTSSAQAIPYQPGKLVLSNSGEVIEQTIDWDDAFYDTVEITPTSSQQFPSTNLQPFANPSVAGKSFQHTNLTEPRKIPSRYLFKMFRIGVHVRQMAGAIVPDPRDVVSLYETAYAQFLINTNLITKGPLLRYQSGYGVTGPSTANDFSTLTLGVPSGAAAPKLKKQHDISERDQLNVTMTIDTNAWIAGGQSPSYKGAVSQGQGYFTQAGGVLPTMYGDSILTTIFFDGAVSRPLGT